MSRGPAAPEPTTTLSTATRSGPLRNGNRRGDPTSAPRCQARRRTGGGTCGQPAMRGKRVCRLHGGKGGAPKGPRNGQWRHGCRTADLIAALRAANRTRREMAALARLAAPAATDATVRECD